MSKLRQTYKFLRIVCFIAAYMVHAVCVRLRLRDHWMRKAQLAHMISSYSRKGLSALNIDVRLDGRLSTRDDQNVLVVCNHLSYVDILVLSAHFPSCFVTSVEIRETPGLGALTEMAGCLYVERRSRSGLKNEVAQLSEALMSGLNVLIFPEATSTNGDQVLRFRRPLFQAALDADRPVLPLCLNYLRINGDPVDKTNRNLLFWYGDMAFLPHLWKLAGCESVEVQVSLLAKLSSSSYEEAGQLAFASQKSVEAVYQVIQ